MSDLRKSAERWFARLRVSLGMTMPANNEIIIDFLVDDVMFCADSLCYSDSDFVISFRRFLESNKG